MKKELINGVVVSVVTAIVLGVGAWIMGVFEKGTIAADKELIRTVIAEELQTDAGQTYSARLAEVGTQVTILETRVGELKDDVEDLEDIALDLAGGN
jgi:hypothetical protein